MKNKDFRIFLVNWYSFFPLKHKTFWITNSVDDSALGEQLNGNGTIVYSEFRDTVRGKGNTLFTPRFRSSSMKEVNLRPITLRSITQLYWRMNAIKVSLTRSQVRLRKQSRKKNCVNSIIPIDSKLSFGEVRIPWHQKSTSQATKKIEKLLLLLLKYVIFTI